MNETHEHLSFTMPYPPSANRYWRVVNGRAVKSAAARAYQRTVAAMFRRRPMTGEVIVGINVYRPAKRGDVDNSIKVLLDALKGIAFHDDKQVKRIDIERHDTDPKNPRADVVIEAAMQAL